MDEKGEYLGHTMYSGFLYAYLCPLCRKVFKSVAPELSSPTICEHCYHWSGEVRKYERKEDRHEATDS